MARELTAFVVPGLEIARARGLDPAAAGLRPVDTPRHAGVLLLVGELPEGLRRAAAVVYAQMPRPRAILALGVGEVAPLPASDVAAPLDQAGLASGVAKLRRIVASASFSPAVAEFDVAAVRTATTYTCPMHPEIVRDRPGQCPICGMDLVPRDETAQERVAAPHAAHRDHGAAPRHEEHSPAAHSEHGAHLGQVGGAEQQHQPAADHGAHAAGDRHEHGQHQTGSTDQAAMSHAEHEALGQGPAERGTHEGTGGAHGGHGTHGEMAGSDMAGMQHDGADHAAHDAGRQHAGTAHDMPGMAGMDHGAHAGGGFMSMVAMTRDLPRSADGLPMEWVETPFGPLFPGLPGGLALTLTLDGDTVARAAVAPGVAARGLAAGWPGPAAALPDRLAGLDPLAPVAYRALAARALADAAGDAPGEAAARAWVGATERERAASHLNWLAAFAHLLGARRLEERAAALHRALLAAPDAAAVARLRPAARAFARRARRTPLLRRRLDGIGSLGAGAVERQRGPVARAAGERVDARAGDPAYRALGFAPVVHAGDDAWARLLVRLAEIEQSLDLVAAASALAPPPGP
ncbi:MAG TPA: heavy metal-binding domain-containing protein, partial [Thermomicrobiales bacterium]|nr:heavy metal-binding domain-containing protein [Thermomicrobiales bacterium]